MTSQWEERVYAVVVALHPRAFRTEYGQEMKLMLTDMLKDPETPRWRVWLAMLDDIGNLMRGGVRLGAMFGLFIVAIWLVHRQTGLPDPNLSLAMIGLSYVAVGFTGARRSGFLRGVGAGVLAGMVSSLTFAGDELFYGHHWAHSPMFLGILIISAGEGLSLVLLGALVARCGDIQRRVRRSALAFADAWIASQ
jgi:hypothetical protein